MNLAPETIDLFYSGAYSGRPGTRGSRNRALTVAVVAWILILGIAYAENELLGRTSQPSAVTLLFGGDEGRAPIELPLLHDPVGVLLFIVAGMTPVFCGEQIAAIQLFVQENVNNGAAYGLSDRQLRRVRISTDRANRRYRAVGGRSASTTILLASIGSTAVLMADAGRAGIYSAWNPTGRSDSSWAVSVYDSWWANPDVAWPLWLAQLLAGTYMFYFLAKKLAMGFIFAFYVRDAAAQGFGITQQILHNTDGYWGLRWLRRFMQWTYVSTLSHLALTLGVFGVWLPIRPSTVIVILLVMAAAVTVVLYPSSMAYNSSVQGKMRATRTLYSTPDPIDPVSGNRVDAKEVVSELWTRPHLPFKVRNTVSAVLVYVVAPIGLLVLSSAIGSG